MPQPRMGVNLARQKPSGTPDKYVFRKPAWRRIFPVFLMLLVWVLPIFLWRGVKIAGSGAPGELAEKGIEYLVQHGVTLKRAAAGAGALTGVLLVWWFFGFGTLVMTPQHITRRLPLIGGIPLKWSDMDEVLIDHVENYFEGDSTAKRVLTLYRARRFFIPWRRTMRISDSEFDDYDNVEQFAVGISIPAIAARVRQQIESSGKPALFPIREASDATLSFLYAIFGLSVTVACAYNPLWKGWAILARPYIACAAVVFLFMALYKLMFRQIGVDGKNLYIMRRGLVTKTIPIDSIADIHIRDNHMLIYAVPVKGGKKEFVPGVSPHWRPRKVFSTNRFVRNRGVLLDYLRQRYEDRRRLDATPILPIRSIQYAEADEEPPTEV